MNEATGKPTRLCDIGVLEERKAGREKLFVNPALLRVLTPRSA